MQLPFFILARFDSKFHYDEINGYEFIMQRDVALASLFYFLLACYFTMRWLSRKFKSDAVAVWSMLAAIFTCSIYYYFTYEPFYSHCESFFLIALFIHELDLFFEKPNTRSLILAGISFAGIVLVRPTNGLVILLIPFMAGTATSLKNGLNYLLSHKISSSIAIILSSGIISIQPIINYLQCGNFFEWGYKNEGFIFSKPKLWELFFSFEAGIFIWLPMFIACIVGMLMILKRNKFEGISLMLFMIVLFYVYASWWAITYGDSPILRPYTDFTSLNAYLLAIFLYEGKARYKYITRFFLVACVLYNIKINYQYARKIIHFDRMNAEKFLYTFDKISDDYKECLGGYRITGINSAKEPKLIFEAHSGFETQDPFFTENNSITDPINPSNHCLAFIENEYNTGIDIFNNTAIYAAKNSFAKISLKRLEVDKDAAKEALVIMHVTYPNTKKDFFYTIKVNELPQNNTMTWREWNYSIELPKILYPNYKLTFYVWNITKQKFYIDDLDVKIYEVI
jgi:hypothetical protein